MRRGPAETSCSGRETAASAGSEYTGRPPLEAPGSTPLLASPHFTRPHDRADGHFDRHGRHCERHHGLDSNPQGAGLKPTGTWQTLQRLRGVKYVLALERELSSHPEGVSR